MIVGTAVIAAIAVLGYYSYRQRSLVEAPQPPAASSEASGRGAPAGAGVIGPDPAAGAKADDSAELTSPAPSPSGTPTVGLTRAAANRPRPGRQPVESQEAKAAAAPIVRPQAINASRAVERGPSRPEACTEAVAALGLCTPKPAQKKETETAAAIKAAIARPQATDTGKAGGQEPPRQETCTEAVAALGLCAPKTTQRRE